MLTKKEIRQQVLKMRRDVTEDQVTELSELICNRICETSAYKEAEKICLYMPIDNEVDVTMLAHKAWEEGKSLWLPKVNGTLMDFFKFDQDTSFVTGAYGVLEPVSEEILEMDAKTLVLMPGVAFSADGGRVGYGSGYYDRYLHGHGECMTIAVCYGFQIMEELPLEEHDVKPDVIICENALIEAFNK